MISQFHTPCTCIDCVNASIDPEADRVSELATLRQQVRDLADELRDVQKDNNALRAALKAREDGSVLIEHAERLIAGERGGCAGLLTDHANAADSACCAAALDKAEAAIRARGAR